MQIKRRVVNRSPHSRGVRGGGERRGARKYENDGRDARAQERERERGGASVYLLSARCIMRRIMRR
jgi:hypothetical protein